MTIVPARKDFHPSFSEWFPKAAIAVGIAWYLLLCLLHYLSDRPLWNDEACVFQSIQAFRPHEFFTQNLLAYQVFPRLYLLLIQKISQLFDFHLWALRFPSFVCMLAAFFVWLKIASYELKNRIEYLTFVLCWSASAVLIYYSAELKQYSLDVLASALYLGFLYHQEKLENSPKASRYLWVLILLPGLVLFSYPAYLFALLPLYNLFLSVQHNRRRLRFLMTYLSSFLVFGLLSYSFDIRLRPIAAVTHGFGDYFVSFNSVGEFLKTTGEGTMNLLSRWFVERPKILKYIGVFFVMGGFLRMFYGFFLHIKKDCYRLKSIHTVALVIFVELFILGALKKYPFTVPRTSLFFCPVVLFLTVKAIADLKGLKPLWGRILQGAFLYYLIFVSLGISFFVFNKALTYRPELW